MNGKLVAILLDESGKCEKVLEVKNLTFKEYQALKNEESENKTKLLGEKEAERLRELSIEKEILNLNNNLFHLAKSTFDNFVDRGVCETTNEFEKAYFDLIFSEKEIDPSLYPVDFAKILKEIRLWEKYLLF